MQIEVRPRLYAPVIACALAMVGAAAMLYYEFGLLLPHSAQSRIAMGMGNGYSFGNDFYPVWLTERETRMGHVDLYGPEMTRKIQTGLFGRPMDPGKRGDPPVEYRQFAYPAFTDLLLWPAALPDFPQLRLLVVVLFPLLTAISFWFWIKALDWDISPLWFGVLVLLAFSSYQMLEAFFAEQPGVLVGSFLAAAAIALRRNQLLLAGSLLASTLIKPQMTLLAILFLLLWSFSNRARARLWQGFFTIFLTCMIAALWIWPHWIGQWIAILLGYHRYATPPLTMLLLETVLPRSVGAVLTGGIVAAGIVLAWRNRKAAPDSYAFWITLALLLCITSVTLLPGQAVYDHLILIPAILMIVQYRTTLSRLLAITGAVVLFWQWFAAVVLLLLRPLSSQPLSNWVLALPIRAAAPLPFLVLALLWRTSRITLSRREPV
jgi:hypothetical protein